MMGSEISVCCVSRQDNEKSHLQRRSELEIEKREDKIFLENFEEDLQWDSIDVLLETLSRRKMKSLFTYLTYIILNYVGMPEEPYTSIPMELTEFCYRLFKDIKNSEKKEIVERVKNSGPSSAKLVVNLTLGEGLKPMNPNGMSNPFCKLWITDDDIQQSRVIKDSLNPEWKEEFIFKWRNLKHNVLHLEVWNENSRGLGFSIAHICQARGCQGCVNLFREVRKNICISDQVVVQDLMGYVKIPINSISSTSRVSKYFLQSRKLSDKSNRGAINLDLKISVQSKSNHFNIILRHIIIMKLCLIYSLSRNTQNVVDVEHWVDIIPRNALTLLYQHSLQGSINVLETSICRWLVTIHICTRENQRLNFGLIHEVLVSMDTQLHSHEFKAHENLEKELRASFTAFLDYCKIIIQNHLSVFQLESENGRLEFQEMLSCLMITTKYLPHNIIPNLNYVFKEEVKSWYRENFIKVIYNKRTRQIDCNTAREQLEKIVKNVELMDKIFKKVWTNSYTSIIYSEMDSMLEKNLKDFILTFSYKFDECDEKDVESSISFMVQLYLALKYFSIYIIQQLPEERNTLAIEKYHEWFGMESLFKWYDWFNSNSKIWIKNSIEREEMVRVDDYIYCSHSARDAIDVIHQRILLLWKTLLWPDPEATLKMVDTVIDLCNYFASETEEMIRDHGFYEIEGRFDISQQLCIIISNFSEVANYTDVVKNEIKKQCDLTVFIVVALERLDTLGTDMVDLTAVLCNDTIMLMKKEIKRYIKEICKADNDDTQLTHLTEICDYINSNMKTSYRNLRKEPFIVLAKGMWRATLQCVEEEVHHFSKGISSCFQKNRLKYIGLTKTISRCKDIFHADGHGLENEFLTDEYYTQVMNKIDLRTR